MVGLANAAPVDDEIPGIDDLILVTTQSGKRKISKPTPKRAIRRATVVQDEGEESKAEISLQAFESDEEGDPEMPTEEPAAQFKLSPDCERGTCDHPHHLDHFDR